MLNLLSPLVCIAILFYVLKYRVHIHVTYTKNESSRAGSQSRRSRVSGKVPGDQRAAAGPRAHDRNLDHVRTEASSSALRDITSALINQGCTPAHARKAAARACASDAQDFDTLLRRAIQEAA